MKHLIDESEMNYFSLLTAEEQLSDIRQYLFRAREEGDLDATQQDNLVYMLQFDARDKSNLINALNHMLDVFNFKTSAEILNEGQKTELKIIGSTVVLVPKSKLDVFYFWVRSLNYSYKKVIEHTIVDAFEFLIWKEKKTDVGLFQREK